MHTTDVGRGNNGGVRSAWDRPDIRAALAGGDWSRVLRAVQDAGLSQSKIATLVGISQSQVSRLAAGRTKDPGIRTVRALCDGLGIPRHLAGLAGSDGTGGGGEDTDRREFLAVSVGVAAAAVLGPDDGHEQLLRQTTQSYRTIEQTTPAAALLGAASGHLRLARRLAEHAHPAEKPRLFAAASEAAGLVGWLYADLANATAARSHYRLAVESAGRAGHPLLWAYMQGSLGQYAVSAGEARQGLRLIRDAAARLPKTAPATARAWLAALDGVALAHLGDTDAWRMLDDAERYTTASGHGGSVWPWVFAFDKAKIDQYRIVAGSRLGRLPRGLAEVAGTMGRSPKQNAATLVEQARAATVRGAVEQGCQLATEAHRIAQRYGSERVRVAVRDFRATITADTTAVRDLDDALYDSYGEPG